MPLARFHTRFLCFDMTTAEKKARRAAGDEEQAWMEDEWAAVVFGGVQADFLP